MAYDIHIHKKSSWIAKEGQDISEEQWKQVIEEDPDLELSMNVVNNIPCGIWKHSKTGNQVPFYYHRGEIRVSGADEEIIVKAKDIASKLGARVQGDEDEFYD